MNADGRVGDSLGYRQDNKMPRYDMYQGKLSKRIPATNLGGAHCPRQDHSPADVRQDGQTYADGKRIQGKRHS